MPNEIIIKKLEQMKELLGELERLLEKTFKDFRKDLTAIRAAERNFQLTVDLASDVNTQILIEKTGKAPDTYKQSFSELERINVLTEDQVRILIESTKIRNILVHEYDFEEDYKKFYRSAKKIIPIYFGYIKSIYSYIR